jgi:branched-chain amino acid aminotransferase
MKHEERKISVEELESWLKSGKLQEAFGAGTAAVVAPIDRISIEGIDYTLPVATPETFMMRVKHKLMDIRTGASEDIFGWNTIV